MSSDPRIRQPYRSSLDLIANVLYVLKSSESRLSKASIMKHAFISYAQIVDLLPLLIEQNLVLKHEQLSNSKKNDEEYTISNRGKSFIDNYWNVYKMLCNGNPTEIMPIRILDYKKIN